MAEYIEREAAVSNLELLARHEDRFRQSVILGVVDTIRAMEAADVAPVVHGRWTFEPETENTLSMAKCNICGWWTLDPSVDGVYKYCPICGARMDGDAE